jgi:predicted DNA-binding protein
VPTKGNAPVIVRLAPEVRERLSRVATSEGRSLSDVVREAIMRDLSLRDAPTTSSKTGRDQPRR